MNPESDSVPPIALRETCRLVRGAVPLWPYHRQRLASGGCGEEALGRADLLVAREGPAYSGPDSSRLRLSLTIATEGSAIVEVKRRLSSLDVPGGPLVAAVEVQEPPVLPPNAAKPYDRSWWDEAQSRAQAAGAHQAVITLGGDVVDGGDASVFVVLDGVLCTPEAPSAIAGVGRAFVLDRCLEEGIPAHVGPLALREFEDASEAFFTNAFAGAVAIRGRGGPLFDLVSGWFDEAWRA